MLFATSIIGGRILFIISNNIYYHFAISSITALHVGFSYAGALALSLAGLYLYTKVFKINFLALLDYCAPFFLLNQAFVRIGCLMAGCCYGISTGSFFGVTYKTVDDALRHPVQGYETILLLVIYIATRIVYEKSTADLGKTSCVALFLYGTGRFFVEFFREGGPAVFMNVSFTQVVCLFLALGSSLAMVGFSKRKSAAPFVIFAHRRGA
jgi:phosphatidylglycerol---prolipoprotein diacylglyceryl transferase